MTALIIVAVIVAMFAAVLLIPIKIYADYHGDLRLWVKVLFLRFDFIPKKEKKVKDGADEDVKAETEPPPPKAETEERPPDKPPKVKNVAEPRREQTYEKAEKPKEPPPPKPKKEKETPEAEAEETAGFIDNFLHYYSLVKEFFDPFRRALRRLLKIDELNVDVRVGTQDAANTAIYTGMLWGVAGNLLGLVERFVTVKKPAVNIVPAYNQSVLTAEGGCIIRTNPANIIGAAAIAALAYFKYKYKKKKQEVQK